MYEARKVSNFLLARYDNPRFYLTNLRLNKLLYFIHGWSLTSRANGLIRNHFEAWELGPVVRAVYDTFKVYGDGPINAPASHVDYASGEYKTIAYEDISEKDAAIICRVFERYDQYTTNELVRLSHEPGGPWDSVFKSWSKDNRTSSRIPNELIRARFLAEVGGKPTH
jgi:uncharacterized phage-associated protein